jgi:hypothetical protein
MGQLHSSLLKTTLNSSSKPNARVQGLLYHDDIIKEPIHLLKSRYDWSNVESRLNEMVKNEDVKFISYPFDEGQNLSRKR